MRAAWNDNIRPSEALKGEGKEETYLNGCFEGLNLWVEWFFWSVQLERETKDIITLTLADSYSP
jgi:hypothetical protein